MLELAPAQEASEEYRSCWNPAGMSQMQADSVGWAAVGAGVGAFLTGLWSWLTQRTKGAADRDIAVIAQWERLTSALVSRIDKLEDEVRELREENAGLLATIRQNSQSTAQLLGDSPVVNAKDSPDGR